MVCLSCSILSARQLSPTAQCYTADHALVSDERWSDMNDGESKLNTLEFLNAS